MEAMDAYSEWLHKGNYGSIDDFYTSLTEKVKGDQGEPGRDGFTGKDTGYEADIGDLMGRAIGGTIQKYVDEVVKSGNLDGKDGTDGFDGINGSSAYEIATDNGFEGTEQEWLASLRGLDGDPGVIGQPGKDGLPGKDGESIQGEPGPKGDKGDPGNEGLSAYEIWRGLDKKRKNKTEKDFLLDLVRTGWGQFGALFVANTTPQNITGLIESGTNIIITGAGTKANPYVINSTGSGGGTYHNLVVDHAVTDSEDGDIFTNTGSTSVIDIDFSAASANTSYKFMVTDADGFSLTPTGTIYIAGQPVTTPISSTTIGSVAIATVISGSSIILETTGAWEYA